MSAGGFLDRWSRRKREAEPAAASDAVPPPEAAAPTPVSPEPGAADAPPPDLPPLDSLTRDTPLTPFLQKGVPEALKNAALRRMWLLDPAIRDHVDFAVDYAWDWNVPGGVPGHGGAITRDSVERFLDSLKAPEERQIVEAAPEAPETAPTEPVPIAPPAEATPDAQTPVAAAEPETPRPATRRHGGAMPT